MPYTIIADIDTARCYCEGVFETSALAERHLRRRCEHIRRTNHRIVEIKGDIGQENRLSLEAVKKAANFSLTVLHDLDAARKKGYVKQAVEKLETALGEVGSRPIKFFKFHWIDGFSIVLEGCSIQEALLETGYNSFIVENYRDFITSVEEVPHDVRND